MEYKLYGTKEHIISNSSIDLNNSYADIKKMNALNIAKFFNDLNLYVSITNNVFSINKINYKNFDLKTSDNILNSFDTQKFDVKKSYIISVDKEVMEDIKKFYCLLKKIDKIENNVNNEEKNNKVVFRADNEFNLKNAFDETDIVTTDDSLLNDSNDYNTENHDVETKKGGSAWLIIVCVIAGIALAILAIMIGLSILNMN